MTPIAPLGVAYTLLPNNTLRWGPLDIAAKSSYSLAFTALVSDSLAVRGSTVDISIVSAMPRIYLPTIMK